MGTTIKDLAKQLNMSVSTVSYALNNGPRSVPAEVKERVLKLAKELDYRPNRIAQSMVTGKTFTIGIVPTGKFENFVVSPFVLSCLNGIVNTCEQEGYDVLLFTRFDNNQEFEIANSMSGGRVDGLVFMAPLVGSGLMEIADRRGIPFVVVSSQNGSRYPTITVDNTQIVELAVNRLLELGHTKIGNIFGSLDLEDGALRKDAFEILWKGGKFECCSNWVLPGAFTQSGGKEAAMQILTGADLPTAIFCSNDEMAYGAISAAKDLGLDVPEDLSVIGVDNSPWSGIISPPLTTIAQPAAEMATCAVKALLDQIENGHKISSQQFLPQLIERATATSPKEHKQS